MDFRGKTVLVTGGATGMGLEFAKLFVNDGAKVIVCGRRQSALDAAKESVPSLDTQVCDVSSQEQLDKIASHIEATYGGLDVLFNNAGVMVYSPVLEEKMEDLEFHYKVNVFGPIMALKTFLPQLKKKSKSMVVNVSSSLAYAPYPKIATYSSTKAALHSLSICLRQELKGTPVKVVEILPPLVDTPMVQKETMPKMAPDKFAQKSYAAIKRGKEEVRVGVAHLLYAMSRAAPKFVEAQMGKY